MKIKCHNCGEEFEQRRTNQKYCSIKCRQRYNLHIYRLIHEEEERLRRKMAYIKGRKLKLKRVKCQTCGVEFMQRAYRQKYCCVNCRYVDYQRKKKCTFVIRNS